MREKLQRLWLDLALSAFGLAIAAVSLPYPFGRDQGLYHYVAREWVLRGAIPYRDVFDHKPPGIYALHAIAIRVFGVNMWGIRVLEILGVVAVGLVAAGFTHAPGEKPKPGMRGVGVLAAVILYFGYLNFWDTAQSELWYSLLGVGSVLAARNISSASRAELVSGLLAGTALIFKPPALFFALFAVGVLFVRWRREGGLVRLVAMLVRFGVASAVPLGLVVAYFGAHHALGAMVEIVLRANSYYAQHETGWRSWRDPVFHTWGYFQARQPISTAALLASLLVLRTKDRERRARMLLALGLCAAAYLAVLLQAKFYELHWTATLAPATVVCVVLASETTIALDALLPRPETVDAWLEGPLVAGAYLVLLFFSSGSDAFDRFVNDAHGALSSCSRNEYAAGFAFPTIGFWADASERTGNYIREHSSPDDFVAVRGFEPQIYVVAQRRYPGRFFWTTFFVNPWRESAEKRARWQAEDERALRDHPPRFVVTLAGVHDGPDSEDWFVSRGYVARETIGPHTILELPR